MTYRKLLMSLLTVSLCVACGPKLEEPSDTPGASADANTYKWKMVTTWPKNFPGLGTAPERFAKNVELMSQGQLQVKVFGAGELVPALEVFDAVSGGTAEMGHGAGYYWKGKAPEAQFFTTVPFGMTAQEMNGWIHHGGGQALWEEVYSKFGLVPLAAGNTGVQMGGWFNKEINSVADLKGLKMRIPGLGGEVFKRIGGLPVLLPGSELFTALQTGAIDASEWVAPYNDLAFGLHKAAKYYYYPGWHEPGPALELIVQKAAFDALPPHLQAIVRVAARDANQDMLDEYTARNASALEVLVKEHGVILKPFPADVLAALKAASKEVLAEEAKKSPMATKIYTSLKAFQDQSKPYYDITERAYINAR